MSGAYVKERAEASSALAGSVKGLQGPGSSRWPCQEGPSGTQRTQWAGGGAGPAGWGTWDTWVVQGFRAELHTGSLSLQGVLGLSIRASVFLNSSSPFYKEK